MQLRKECEAQLLNTVQLRSGNICFRPKKAFCYLSLKKSISYLFQQEVFLKAIQLWRQRKVPDEVMGDVYDGHIWHTFKDLDGNKYVEAPYNLMFVS